MAAKCEVTQRVFWSGDQLGTLIKFDLNGSHLSRQVIQSWMGQDPFDLDQAQSVLNQLQTIVANLELVCPEATNFVLITLSSWKACKLVESILKERALFDKIYLPGTSRSYWVQSWDKVAKKQCNAQYSCSNHSAHLFGEDLLTRFSLTDRKNLLSSYEIELDLKDGPVPATLIRFFEVRIGTNEYGDADERSSRLVCKLERLFTEASRSELRGVHPVAFIDGVADGVAKAWLIPKLLTLGATTVAVGQPFQKNLRRNQFFPKWHETLHYTVICSSGASQLLVGSRIHGAKLTGAPPYLNRPSTK